jgi:hypothetical protein
MLPGSYLLTTPGLLLRSPFFLRDWPPSCVTGLTHGDRLCIMVQYLKTDLEEAP